MAASTKPLTTEAIALTEKKMDMTLDDIIKMSKPVKKTKLRISNKNPKVFNKTAQDRSVRAKQFLASRSSLRHGALAKRRSNFQGNQFPVATAAARRHATAPARPIGFALNGPASWNNPRFAAHFNRGTNGGINFKGRLQQQTYQQQQQPHANVVPRQRPQTLDSLFANMKQQRLQSQQNHSSGGKTFQQRRFFQNRRPFQGGQHQQQQQQQHQHHGRSGFAN